MLAATVAISVPGEAVALSDYRNGELAHPKTRFALKSWNNRPQWEQHKSRLRRQILGSAGLLPEPQRDPVSVYTIRRTRHDRYSTQSLRIETLPGLLVGATVYHPNDTTKRWPGVLLPHGHWKRGRVENLPSYSVPALGINLAMQGYVAIAWDMLGYNDTSTISHDFSGWREQLWAFNPMGLQLWNSIRVTDYVLSRPDVDPRRLGCTGASGGATQTILLTAVDSRITCSAPVNMVSGSYQGADPCEEAPNLRLGTNNVEFASMMAPRPMLLVSCTGDWTRNTPGVEYPAIQRVYKLYNRADLVTNAHFDAEHNYDRRTRSAVYRFLGKYLMNDQGLEWVEPDIPEINDEELLAPPAGLPANVRPIAYPELFEQWRAVSRRQTESASLAALRMALASSLMVENPRPVGNSTFGDRVLLNRIGKHDRIPAKWTRGSGIPAILVHPDGSQAAAATPEYKRLCDADRPILALDVFQTGLAAVPREKGGRWYLSYNQTDDANRIQDIVTAISWVRSQNSVSPELIGLGRAALWVLFAAAVTPGNLSVVADIDVLKIEEDVLREGCMVPGIQRAGGIAGARKLVRNLRAKL
ncbi:MAG: hypothetical protein H7039_07720 [Bryobacteraceae bacterium]|nr:hypothetical protein [Bryobacteraceae bacterium]